MANDAFVANALAMLREVELQIRTLLDEMAVVPNAHRARLMVALRLLEDVRVEITKLRDGG